MEKSKNVLELFAGSRSIGKEAEKLGYRVFSVDKFVKKNMDCVCDVIQLSKEFIIENFGIPDIIWASPVCSVWSRTGWFHHWDTEIYNMTRQFVPKTDMAHESIQMIRKTIEIFSWFPNALFYMENPEGMLAIHPVIRTFDVYKLKTRKHKVTYCQYGFKYMKPTNIWTNDYNWIPKSPCNRNSSCHIKSKSGEGLGLPLIPKKYRSLIPAQLCNEILTSGKSTLNLKKTIRQTQLF
jgi:hypothetical protein